MTLEFWDVDLLKFKERVLSTQTQKWKELDHDILDEVLDALQRILDTLYPI
jgi:hypothetical protein